MEKVYDDAFIFKLYDFPILKNTLNKNALSNKNLLSSEEIIGIFPFSKVVKIIAKLMQKSGCFRNGYNQYIGSLRRSYGFNKIIGIQSFDGKVRIRIDYDSVKGAHFNYEDFRDKNNPIKKCIIISDMNYETYKRYIDHLNNGRTNYSKKSITKIKNLKIYPNIFKNNRKFVLNKGSIFKSLNKNDGKKI